MYFSRRTNARRGFTLVEVLISTGLMVVVGLAVYASFNSGIKIWKRVVRPDIIEDVNIFLEKLRSDLKNSVLYQGIEFVGQPDSIHFATLVTTNSSRPGLHRGMGEVSYSFEAEEEAVIQHKRNLSAIYKGREGIAQEVLHNVVLLELNYYYYEPLEEEYLWVEQWQDKEKLPLSVLVKIVLLNEGKNYTFTKRIDLPLGQE